MSRTRLQSSRPVPSVIRPEVRPPHPKDSTASSASAPDKDQDKTHKFVRKVSDSSMDNMDVFNPHYVALYSDGGSSVSLPFS